MIWTLKKSVLVRQWLSESVSIFWCKFWKNVYYCLVVTLWKCQYCVIGTLNKCLLLFTFADCFNKEDLSSNLFCLRRNDSVTGASKKDLVEDYCYYVFSCRWHKCFDIMFYLSFIFKAKKTGISVAFFCFQSCCVRLVTHP